VNVARGRESDIPGDPCRRVGLAHVDLYASSQATGWSFITSSRTAPRPRRRRPAARRDGTARRGTVPWLTASRSIKRS